MDTGIENCRIVLFNHVKLERIHPARNFTCFSEKHFSSQDHTMISTLPRKMLYQHSSYGNEYGSVNTACYYIVLVLKCIISVRILWRWRKNNSSNISKCSWISRTWPLDDYVTLPFGTNSSIYCNLAKRDVEHFSPEHFPGGISTRNSATNLHVKAHNPRLLVEQEWTFQNASGVLPS